MAGNKFFNKKIEVNGIKYDSKREYQRHLILIDAEKKGIISNIELQPLYELLPNQYKEVVKQMKTKSKIVNSLVERAITYTADFRYIKDGELIVEDVKISKKLVPKEYILKRKMLLFFHKIELKEVFSPNEPI